MQLLQINYNYCGVKRCRYPKYHIARGYRCTKCRKFGHGKFECGDRKASRKLKRDKLLVHLHCNVQNCQHINNHTIEGHCCGKCEKYNHGIANCVYDEGKRYANMMARETG